jgi:hypothetical protein
MLPIEDNQPLGSRVSNRPIMNGADMPHKWFFRGTGQMPVEKSHGARAFCAVLRNYSCALVARQNSAINRSFRLSPYADLALVVEFDVDHVGMTADRAVFNVLLAQACRKIERDDDFLATGVADVGSFVLHSGPFAARDISVRAVAGAILDDLHGL